MRRFKIFSFFLIFNLLMFPLSSRAASRTGVGVIGYGDIYTNGRVISVVGSLTYNNNINKRPAGYYEVYSSRIYLNILELGTTVKDITVDGVSYKHSLTTLGNNTVYQLDDVKAGDHIINVIAKNASSDYMSTSNYIYIRVKPNVKVFNEVKNVPINKVFNIKFTKPLKTGTNLGNYISVLDQFGTNYCLSANVSSNDPYTVKVHGFPYAAFSDFTLHILPGIQSNSGQIISEERVLRFYTGSNQNLSRKINSNMQLNKSTIETDLLINFD